MHKSREILENINSNYLGGEITCDCFSSYLSFFPPLYFFIMSILKQFGLENLISPLASDQNNNGMPVCGADT